MIEKYVDAEELKRLLSSLVIVVGCLLIGGLFASLVVPGLRNANRPATPTAVQPAALETGWLDPAEFPPQKGAIIPPVDPAALMKESPELVARGKELFESNCTQCHGPQGRGDGPAAATMTPRPRNFTSPDGWKNGPQVPGIFKTLKEGISGTSMASFSYLSKKNRMALAQYIQSLGAFPHGTGGPESVEALKKELASAGEKTPNKIPVSMAMAKLQEEFKAAPSLEIGLEDGGPGVEILRRVVVDPARAAQFLAQSNLWRIGYRELAALVAQETPVNGFSTGSAALTPAEWQLLQSELLRRLKSK
ncbi:MAG: putative Cytochrome c subfamily [Acidobacteria bacterium]|nr:putative Cytochrome c subfamily [Acidobacteriota bacterium]